MDPNLAFKSGVTLFLIAEISLLWGLMYVAFQEYDPSHIETAGIVIFVTSAAVGSAALLWALYQILKWKPS